MSLDLGARDTICALSSAKGPAALALVRISGRMAYEILQKIFVPSIALKLKPFIAYRGQAVDDEGRAIDDVMALYFPKGRSFTGEESAEIHCHGNAIIVDQLLRALCRYGARLAEPGEFSLRAMLNGKIDLAQAESIADLIHAQSEHAKDVALRGVLGGLKARCSSVRATIVSVVAEIEARMDFPDEELGDFQRSQLAEDVRQAIDTLDILLANADLALKLHDGMRLVICGLPNAGKSTLLNRLSGEDRAIVHESAGTTRDVIEARMHLWGVPVTLVDIAGIRSMEEASAIERIGIEKAFLELKRADGVIWLADGTKVEPFNDQIIAQALAQITAPVIKVLNKADLFLAADPKILSISAEKGRGIEDLKSLLSKCLIKNDSTVDEMFITRARQRDELMAARSSLFEAHQALLLRLVDEVVSSELRAAGLAFDRLFGTTLSEDVLDRIFSQFCIGK